MTVCEVTARQNEPFVSYNERAALLNSHLRVSLHIIPAAKYWQHHDLINQTNNAVYVPDGIYLNYIENKALYQSYRRAILWNFSKSSNVKLTFLMLHNLSLVKCRAFQLLSHIKLTSGTEHPMF